MHNIDNGDRVNTDKNSLKGQRMMRLLREQANNKQLVFSLEK